MPSIISRPAVTRTNTRGLSQDDVQTYLDLMDEAGTTDMVTVDDSTRATKDAAYARGERVRTQARRLNMPNADAIQVFVVKDDETGLFTANVFFRQA